MFVAAVAARAGRRLRRELLDAGGGYANLELYERLGSSPDVTVVTILGEGSFHQVHGGTTTNQPDAAERRARVFGYSQHYAELRGPRLPGPGQADPLRRPDHRPAPPGARSRAGCRPTTFAEAAAAGDPDGRPSAPTPVPDELRVGVHRGGLAQPAVDARRPGSASRVDERARPTCSPTRRSIAASGPTGSSRPAPATAGRALFLASICELVGHGAGAVDRRRRRATTARSTRACATSPASRPTTPTTVAAVREIVGDGPAPRGARVAAPTARRRPREFEAYAPLVPRRLVRGRRRHHRQRPPGVAGVRAGPGRGGQADPHPPRRVRGRPGDGEVLAHVQPRRVPQARAVRPRAPNRGEDAWARQQ